MLKNKEINNVYNFIMYKKILFIIINEEYLLYKMNLSYTDYLLSTLFKNKNIFLKKENVTK